MTIPRSQLFWWMVLAVAAMVVWNIATALR